MKISEAPPSEVPAQVECPSDPSTTGIIEAVEVGTPDSEGRGRAGSYGVGDGDTIGIVERAGPGEVVNPHGPRILAVAIVE